MSQCFTVDAEREASFAPVTAAFNGENCFATTPMQAIAPLFQQPDEAQLHTDFEQAISDRLIAVNVQLARISGPLPEAETSYTYTEPLPGKPEQVAAPSVLQRNWQRSIMFACFALMFILIGFDLMGLLMLYMH